MNTYDEVRDWFIRHCQVWEVPVPVVGPALESDPCDFTDHRSVRLNVEAAGDIKPEWHAAHVFGHYLCCLHAWADETEGETATTDLVADTIAKMALT